MTCCQNNTSIFLLSFTHFSNFRVTENQRQRNLNGHKQRTRVNIARESECNERFITGKVRAGIYVK